MALRRANQSYLTYEVGAALTEFRFVKLTDVDSVEPAGAGDDAIGVVCDAFAADYAGPVPVTVDGVEFVTAGAAVALGAFVKSDATGRAVTAGTAGDLVSGRAISAAGAAGDIISVQLFNSIIHA